MIIAGGMGSRLVKSGFNRPKSLISVNGQTLIDTQLDFLVKHGFKRVYVALGYGSNEILEHLARRPISLETEIVLVVEDEVRGTGGALLGLKNHIKGDIFVIYGDVLVDIYMDRILKGNQDSIASIITRRSNHPSDSDLVEVNHERKLLFFHSKPHKGKVQVRNIAATGIFIFSPSSLHKLSIKFGFSSFNLEREGVMYLLSCGDSIATIPAIGMVQDLGTFERMQAADEIWQLHQASPKKWPAIFLDRDGTINYSKGYISKVSEFVLYEDTPEAISRLRKQGYFVFVVTNQPVIARGEASWGRLEEIHFRLDEILEETADTFVDEIFICPHHPDTGFVGEVFALKFDCNCRKPKTGLIERCLEDYPVDLSRSWVVGDSWRDFELAEKLNINFAAVRNDKLKYGDIKFFWELPDFVDFVEGEK